MAIVVAGLTACGWAEAPKAAADWLAIDYHKAPGLKPVVHEGAVYSCVRLLLRPEDGGASKGTWEVTARIQHPMKLPSSYRSAKQAEAACAAAGGTFVRLDKLQSFINGAASESPANASASCTEAEKEPAAEAREAPSSSELARAVAQWNDRFFNMDTAVTRQNADRFHGRGTEHKHLAQEVTHLVMPKAVQQRILERLATHREALFGDGGAGQGGTTGAYFLAGNVGFGNANQGANLMDLVFPPDPSAKKASSGGALNGDGDAYAIKKGGKLFGEIDDGSGGAPAARPPDLLAYEEEVRRLLMQRSDVDLGREARRRRRDLRLDIFLVRLAAHGRLRDGGLDEGLQDVGGDEAEEDHRASPGRAARLFRLDGPRLFAICVGLRLGRVDGVRDQVRGLVQHQVEGGGEERAGRERVGERKDGGRVLVGDLLDRRREEDDADERAGVDEEARA